MLSAEVKFTPSSPARRTVDVAQLPTLGRMRADFAEGRQDDRAGRRRSSPRTGARETGLRVGAHEVPGGLAANEMHRVGAWASPVTLTALLVGLGAVITVLQKAPCLSAGWGAPNVYYAGCYSDWAALYGARGFAANPWAPFAADSTFEYPVLMSLVASVAAQITQWLPDLGFGAVEHEGPLTFWLVNLVFVLGLWAATALLTVRMAGRRWHDGLMVAIGPGMILAGTINWDMWAVALTAWGMYVWSRGAPGRAGVLLGLGAAMKIYPVLLLGALLVLAVRRRRAGPFVRASVGALGAWLAVNLPLMLTNPEAWSVFFTFSAERGPGLSSLWHSWNLMHEELGLPKIEAGSLSLLALSLFVLWCLGVFVLGLAVRRTPRLAQLAFLIVAGFVLTNKVYSPQFVLWLIPLAALAVPRWKDVWAWMLVEALHFFAVWMYLARGASGSAPQHSISDETYVAAVLAHMLAVLWLCGRVVVEMVRPHLDPVRISAGGDDPLAGAYARGAGRRPRRAADRIPSDLPSGPSGTRRARS